MKRLDKGKKSSHSYSAFNKRKEIKDADGWTYVVRKSPSSEVSRICAPCKSSTAKLVSFSGDYEINGVIYIHRTLEDVKSEFLMWQKQWEESPSCKELEEKIRNNRVHSFHGIDNAIVLGLGSLLSARRDARRCSATQLAALLSLVQFLQCDGIPIFVQDPQYTDVDTQFLTTLGLIVVKDPEAFQMLSKHSLVFAVHCYRDLYCAVAQVTRPTIIVGTVFENFRGLDWSGPLYLFFLKMRNADRNYSLGPKKRRLM